MVTRYDVFALMYKEGGVLRPTDVVQRFEKTQSEYDRMYKILLELEGSALVKKTEHGFQAVRNRKNDLLYGLIQFCIKNDVSYNELLDRNIAEFIARALSKDSFFINDFDLNPRTFSKYIDVLQKNGLLILLSRKPLVAIVPYNSFLADIATYFGFKGSPFKGRREYSEDIKNELTKYRRLRRTHEREYQALIESFEIRFIHHSLSIEGNPITLAQTFKLLKENIVSKDLPVESVMEVRNYQAAFEQMLRESEGRRPLTRESILNYHYLSMRHREDIAGKIRAVPVYIRGNEDFQVAKVKEIEPKLSALVKRYNAFTKQKHPLQDILKFASFLHNEFQHIHPFVDGNSRTTRLITFHFLRVQGIPVFDIPLGLLEEYVDATKGTSSRDDKALMHILQLIILFNLKALNEKLS